MKKIFLLGCHLLIIFSTYSQDQRATNLSVGDIVPDIKFENLFNYSNSSTTLSEILKKKKLLILDFWATWCSPCIGSIPKLESFKKKYNDKIEILGVTYEEMKVVVKFSANLERFKKVTVPASVTEDKRLSKLFPHQSIPHFVWIDGNRRVIAITEGEDLNEENIDAFFKEGKFKFRLKEDETRIAVGKPKFAPSILLKSSDGKDEIKRLITSDLVMHSAFTKYVSGISSGAQLAPANYIFWGNVTIYKLYMSAIYGNTGKGGRHLLNANVSTNVIVDIKDSILYKHVTGREINGKELKSGLETAAWLKENAYCYELEVPEKLSSQRDKIMLDQLNLYFGEMYNIEGLVEKRSNKYLALTSTSKENKIKTKGGEQKLELDRFHFNAQNVTIDQILLKIAQPLQLYPMLEDETGINGNVDMVLNCQIGDLDSMNKELAKYDLRIVEKEKEMNVAVIRTKK